MFFHREEITKAASEHANAVKLNAHVSSQQDGRKAPQCAQHEWTLDELIELYSSNRAGGERARAGVRSRRRLSETARASHGCRSG